jgi:hypothetical protein
VKEDDGEAQPTSRTSAPSSPSSKALSTADDAPASPSSAAASKIVKSGFTSLLKSQKAAEKGGPGGGFAHGLSHAKTGFSKMMQEAQDRLESGQSLEQVAAEGMKVMKEVGRKVEGNVKEIQRKMGVFSNPPPKKKGWKPKPEKDLYRINSITIRSMRVFTRGLITSSGAGAANAAGWHKPILYKEVIVGAAELAAPTKLKDERGEPRIGLHTKEISRVMQKRMVAETGKTNSAVLFGNALGEMSEYF